MTVDKAYIITLKGHSLSESLSLRCQESCRTVGQDFEVWDAFDGTSGEIIIPERHKLQNWIKWIKLYDTELSVSEIAVYLSHLSLWAHCIEINKPIVILEHDSIMAKPYTNHTAFNQIVYLGCLEQISGWPVMPIPPMGQKNTNYLFMLRAHAYAIDPLSAKNLLSYTLKYGINESLDVSIRADIFGIVQNGVFAYDMPHQITTITNRKLGSTGKER